MQKRDCQKNKNKTLNTMKIKPLPQNNYKQTQNNHHILFKTNKNRQQKKQHVQT